MRGRVDTRIATDAQALGQAPEHDWKLKRYKVVAEWADGKAREAKTSV